MSEHDDTPEREESPELEENEVLRAAREAKEARQRASMSQSSKKGINWKTAAAAGLGSAAIIAALIYAQRDKDDD